MTVTGNIQRYKGHNMNELLKIWKLYEKGNYSDTMNSIVNINIA